jgi:hypothetical protein
MGRGCMFGIESTMVELRNTSRGATTTSDSDGSSLGRMDTILLGTSEGKLDGSQLGWIEGMRRWFIAGKAREETYLEERTSMANQKVCH